MVLLILNFLVANLLNEFPLSILKVTGNDSDTEFIHRGGDGSANHTFALRVNGALIFARGANMIPMDELEGRNDAFSHREVVRNAVAGGMNMLRLWAGGSTSFRARLWSSIILWSSCAYL